MTGIGFLGIMLLLCVVATLAYMVGWRDADLRAGRTRSQKFDEEQRRRILWNLSE